MKTTLTIMIAFLTVVCIGFNGWAADDFKVGIVDIKRFQQKSIAYQKIGAELRKKFDDMQKTLEGENKKLRDLEEDFRRQSMMLSIDAQEDKKQELAKKRRYVKYLSEDFTHEMKSEEIAANKALLKGLGKVVQKIAKDDGFKLIYSSVSPGLIFFDDALDITERVIQAFDKMN